MIKLTCAATGNSLYINPRKIIALEEGSLVQTQFLDKDSLRTGVVIKPICRVWIGPGDDEFFPVKELPTTILSIIRQARRCDTL